jgi:Zn-dependent protease with chaperone function
VQGRIRSIQAAAVLSLLLGAAASAGLARAAEPVKVSGYLEFRKGIYLIVDAQRLAVNAKTKFSGAGKAKSPATIPLGYEVKAKGKRQKDGTILATALEAKPNGMAMFEPEVLKGTAEAEKSYREARKVYDKGPDGKEQVVGALIETGPLVDRARRIVDRLLPAYVDPKQVRVYVVDNKDWNAMAMANYSIYVYSGLMKDLDDDELAIVLGHELAHADYEHSRRQASKNFLGGLAGAAAVIGAQMIDNPNARGAATGAAALGVTTFGNVYSREYEDQADRVGLRYVYEAGYDYTKAPHLWERFAEKYGDQGKAANFFFGNHSTNAQRAKDLEAEIQHNYSDPAMDPPSHPASAAPGR